MDKKSLSLRDICRKLISPAISCQRWGMGKQVCEKFGLIKGSIVARRDSRLSLMGAMTLSIHHSFPPAQ
ncbi:MULTISPECIES: hypothetical protein [Pseudomonas]|uniref:hypothetical protein n=1 Tax=Pseudomonas TaxID=286 RepID=UPI000AFE9BFB|nr:MULTISPECIES: hypothetical protein [Pseudomonas]